MCMAIFSDKTVLALLNDVGGMGGLVFAIFVVLFGKCVMPFVLRVFYFI